MFTLIDNAEVYAPEPHGKLSVLIADERIAWMGKDFPARLTLPGLKTLNAAGMVLTPGIVDGHVHIIGGGSEGGQRTRSPELLLSDMVRGGVTTVIGVLGTDDVTRNMASLVAKANGLTEEGVSAWVLTGSYQLPLKTLLGGVREDIALIERIIGVGELALSDHRSSQPTFEEFLRISASARTGGILSGKGGLVNIHLGDGERGLDYLRRAVEETEIPVSQFVPTHMNRNQRLFEEGRAYAVSGGYVDYTTSTTRQFLDEGEIRAAKALKTLLSDGVPSSRISFSSDGQGSLPKFSASGEFEGLTIGRVTSVAEEVRYAAQTEGVPLEDALRAASTTTAEHYKLPRKGRIAEGFDADILLFSGGLELKGVFARGKQMMEDGELLVRGTFE